MDKKRWQVEIIYASNDGDEPVWHAVDEIEELQEIVERGPNFYAIKQIVIKPDASLIGGPLTLETANL